MSMFATWWRRLSVWRCYELPRRFPGLLYVQTCQPSSLHLAAHLVRQVCCLFTERTATAAIIFGHHEILSCFMSSRDRAPHFFGLNGGDSPRYEP